MSGDQLSFATTDDSGPTSQRWANPTPPESESVVEMDVVDLAKSSARRSSFFASLRYENPSIPRQSSDVVEVSTDVSHVVIHSSSSSSASLDSHHLPETRLTPTSVVSEAGPPGVAGVYTNLTRRSRSRDVSPPPAQIAPAAMDESPLPLSPPKSCHEVAPPRKRLNGLVGASEGTTGAEVCEVHHHSSLVADSAPSPTRCECEALFSVGPASRHSAHGSTKAQRRLQQQCELESLKRSSCQTSATDMLAWIPAIAEKPHDAPTHNGVHRGRTRTTAANRGLGRSGAQLSDCIAEMDSSTGSYLRTKRAREDDLREQNIFEEEDEEVARASRLRPAFGGFRGSSTPPPCTPPQYWEVSFPSRSGK